MNLGTLYILGRGLQENLPPTSEFASLISQSQLVIGESRRITERILSRISLPLNTPVFFLDNQNPRELKHLKEALTKVSKAKGQACLFSDMGMPILFDPGVEVLEEAKQLGMRIRCLPSPTSWATACALSGWSPPFQLVGFLSAKAEIRLEELKALKTQRAHLVLLDTPYRFQALLTDCHKVLGLEHQAFLAWEIGTSDELYLWGSLSEIMRACEKRGLRKGEFILLLQKPQ